MASIAAPFATTRFQERIRRKPFPNRMERKKEFQRSRLRIGRNSREPLSMSDLIFIGIVVVFFFLSGLYVRLCEKL